MRKIITFMLTIAASTFVADLTCAETIKLRGVYSVSVVDRTCIRAAGMQTRGIGLGGFGCKTEKGEVECTAKGQCTAICEVCGSRHHRTGLYGILHGSPNQ